MHSTDERALWLARNILPHEPALRAWLSRRQVAGLDVDDIVQDSYARLSTAGRITGVKIIALQSLGIRPASQKCSDLWICLI